MLFDYLLISWVRGWVLMIGFWLVSCFIFAIYSGSPACRRGASGASYVKKLDWTHRSDKSWLSCDCPYVRTLSPIPWKIREQHHYHRFIFDNGIQFYSCCSAISILKGKRKQRAVTNITNGQRMVMVIIFSWLPVPRFISLNF